MTDTQKHRIENLPDLSERAASEEPDEAENLALRTKLLCELERNQYILDDLPFIFRINQLKAFAAFKEKLQDPRWDLRGYFVQPTGAGKTVLFGLMARLLSQPTIIFVPKTSLLEQTQQELIESCGFSPQDIGLIGEGNKQFGRQVTICTYQSHVSLIQSKHREYDTTWNKATVLICDEAHRSLGKVTREKLEAFVDINELGVDDEVEPLQEDIKEVGLLTEQEEIEEEIAFKQIKARKKTAIKCGFTATPQLSAKHIEAAFGTEIARESYADLVNAGILVKYKIIHIDGDLKAGEDINVNITEENEVKILDRENTYRKLLQKYVEVNLSLEQKLKSIAFCANKQECEKFIAIAETEFGLKCIKVTSDEDADQKTKAEAGLTNGSLDIVVTVEKLTEGWNFRPLNAVLRARANASPANIIQGCGRASRTCTGKDFAYIFEPDWKVLAQRKIPNAQEVPHGSPKVHEGSTGNKRVVKRFNIVEALLANGEKRDEIADICDVGEGRSYDFLPEYSSMNHVYFADVMKVREDLEQYALAMTTNIDGLTISNKFRPIVVTCHNGEPVTFNTYLIRAAIGLGLAKNSDEAQAHIVDALIRLKQLLGLTVKLYPKMDKAYFIEKNVMEDLTAFAAASEVSIADLVPQDMRFKRVVCSNGEPVRGVAYLYRAAIALELANKTEDASSKTVETLKALKELINVATFTKMDKEYFENTDNVKNDLEAFATKIGKPVDKLSTSNVSAIEVVCKNGEKVKGQVYLTRAAIAFGWGRTSADVISLQKKTLQKLKELVGVRVNFPPMNEEYFQTPENIRTDLDHWSEVTGVPVNQLRSTNEIVRVDVTFSNGEKIKVTRYLSRAAIALKLAQDSIGAGRVIAQTIKKLQEIAQRPSQIS